MLKWVFLKFSLSAKKGSKAENNRFQVQELWWRIICATLGKTGAINCSCILQSIIHIKNRSIYWRRGVYKLFEEETELRIHSDFALCLRNTQHLMNGTGTGIRTETKSKGKGQDDLTSRLHLRNGPEFHSRVYGLKKHFPIGQIGILGKKLVLSHF